MAKRFEKVYSQGVIGSGIEILQDRETGVQYGRFWGFCSGWRAVQGVWLYSGACCRKGSCPGETLMRTFIAIELERDVRDYLAAVQTEVQGLCRRGNFTPVDNLHLTLHFLGEVGESTH